MAIASVGSLGTGAGSGGGSTIVLTTTAVLESGNQGVLVVVSDNVSTTDGATTTHSTVADSAGNVWNKLREHTNSNGSAGAGVTTSVWITRATATLGSGAQITATLSTASLDRCSSAWEFTSGVPLGLATSAVNDTDASNGFGSSAISGLPSKSRLYLRGLGKEANSTTANTVTASFTNLTPTRSRNNAAAVLVRGEFFINTSTGQTSNPTLAVSGDTSGVFVALEESHTATGAVSAGAATASGSATFLTSTFNATGALTRAAATLSGSALFAPKRTATGTLLAGAATASGSGQAVYHPVGRLTQSRYGVSGRRYGTFAGKQLTPPTFTGTGAVSAGAAVLAGSATVVYDHPVGVLTQSRLGTPGQRYGTFAGKGTATFTGTGTLLAGAATVAGNATKSGPFFTASGSITRTGATLAGSAAFTAPVFTGSGNLTRAAVTLAGSATRTVPVFTATGTLTRAAATLSGSALFAAVVRQASGALVAGEAVLSGSATFEAADVTGGTLFRSGLFRSAIIRGM